MPSERDKTLKKLQAKIAKIVKRSIANRNQRLHLYTQSVSIEEELIEAMEQEQYQRKLLAKEDEPCQAKTK